MKLSLVLLTKVSFGDIVPGNCASAPIKVKPKMSNDLAVQLDAKLNQHVAEMEQIGILADAHIKRIEQSFAELNPNFALAEQSWLATLERLNVQS